MPKNVESLDEILNERKTIEILRSLKEKRQHIRSLHRAIGGSLSTIMERVNSLVDSDLVKETELSRRERCLELTSRGEAVVAALGWLGTSPGIKNPKLDKPKKWMLALLYALREVKGSTRLEKLLFLLKEDLRVTGAPFYSFKSYLFGPFSKEVMEDAKAMRNMKLVDITSETIEAPSELSDALFIRKNYKLTSEGEKQAERYYDELAEDRRVRDAIHKIREYNSMPLSDLLSYVYKKFPKYSPPPEMP